MMKIYSQPFFNRRNWMLENLIDLDLTTEESLMVLLIDYANEFNQVLNISELANKLKLEGNQVDALLNSLINKGYLKIEMANRKMHYQLDGLFLQTEDSKPFDSNSFQNLFSLYEQEFSRPLSQKESEMLSDWIQIYEIKLIEYALREAITHKTLNFAYINKILTNWKQKQFTSMMYEERDN